MFTATSVLYDSRLMTTAIVALGIVLTTLPWSVEACHPSYHVSSRHVLDRNQPFVYKERFPNLPETHPFASGPAGVRIFRNDARFKRLVNNTNPDIVFKDEEGTGADHLMTSRCRYKLNLLAMLVRNFWPELKLRVVDSWEERNRQAVGSLHYEGRAVDLTTSDRDTRKIPRLARLAVQAGFDWVYYESKQHVHASVKPDGMYRQPRELHCFPGSAMVTLATGKKKRMDALQPNDVVLTYDGNGQISPTHVITFMHVHRNETTSYLNILLDNGAELPVSPEHLIYRMNKQPKNTQAIFARDIQLGDMLLTLSRDVNPAQKLTLATVVSVNVRREKGIYAPLTDDGSLFVNDILVSSYAATSEEWLAHLAMGPLRLIWKLSYNIGVPMKSPENGLHWYVQSMMKLTQGLDYLNLPSPVDYHD